MRRNAFVLLAMLLAAPAGAGQVYKWVDQAGRFHFSDTPQPGWTRIDAGHSNTMTAEVPAGAKADGKREADCRQRRDELASYRNAARIVERDALGNEHEYSAEQKKQLIAVSEQKVAAACGDLPEAAEPAAESPPSSEEPDASADGEMPAESR